MHASLFVLTIAALICTVQDDRKYVVGELLPFSALAVVVVALLLHLCKVPSKFVRGSIIPRAVQNGLTAVALRRNPQQLPQIHAYVALGEARVLPQFDVQELLLPHVHERGPAGKVAGAVLIQLASFVGEDRSAGHVPLILLVDVFLVSVWQHHAGLALRRRDVSSCRLAARTHSVRLKLVQELQLRQPARSRLRLEVSAIARHLHRHARAGHELVGDLEDVHPEGVAHDHLHRVHDEMVHALGVGDRAQLQEMLAALVVGHSFPLIPEQRRQRQR